MANVFPVLGWIGILLILMLAITWVLRGRGRILEETRRRDAIRSLILRKLDPSQKFFRKHRDSFARLTHKATGLPRSYRKELRNEITATVVAELQQQGNLSRTDFAVDKEWESGNLADLNKAISRDQSEASTPSHEREL